jgi:integrase
VQKSDYIPQPTKHFHGYAVVRLNGRDHYLGQYGSPEASAKYQSIIADWLANGRQLPDAPITVNEVILVFLKHALNYYEGSPAEVDKIRLALRPLKLLFGDTPAHEFGPRRLTAVRDEMLKPQRKRAMAHACSQGKSHPETATYRLARRTINMRVGIIKRVFKWAVETELVPSYLYHGLSVVAGLRSGRSTAKEAKVIKPVKLDQVEAIAKAVNRHLSAIILLQRLTGARSGEIVIMRACDIDHSLTVDGKPLWVYRPYKHKNRVRGQSREIYLGPAAQEVLKPFLTTDPLAYLFSPRLAREERYAALRQKRRSKIQPSQVSRKKKKPKVQPSVRYTSRSYRHAIVVACRKLGLEAWHPHQLRHTAATVIRQKYGLELARIILGHATAFTTEIYAEVDQQRAMEVMAQLG